MDDTALLTAFRQQLQHTTLAAVSRATGLHRNTLRELRDGVHGMNSHTRAGLTRWLQPVDLGVLVRQGFAAGASLYTLGAQYGLTQAACEQMVRDGLPRQPGDKNRCEGPWQPRGCVEGRTGETLTEREEHRPS